MKRVITIGGAPLGNGLGGRDGSQAPRLSPQGGPPFRVHAYPPVTTNGHAIHIDALGRYTPFICNITTAILAQAIA